MTLREAITTEDNEWFWTSPRTLALWGGEWFGIFAAKSLEASLLLYQKAGREDDWYACLESLSRYIQTRDVYHKVMEKE